MMKIKKLSNKPRRLPLKRWAALDDLRRSIDDAAQEGKVSLIPAYIYSVIEIATEAKVDRGVFWQEAARTYNACLDVNAPTKKPPILTTKEKTTPLPWEYPGRSWYFWLNLFSVHYGWSAEEIGEMDLDDAIALYQEILIDEQLEKEFYYGLSEVAYPYNVSTKKSKFAPMPRPDWMKGVASTPKPVKMVKMLKSMLPQGNVVIHDD